MPTLNLEIFPRGVFQDGEVASAASSQIPAGSGKVSMVLDASNITVEGQQVALKVQSSFDGNAWDDWGSIIVDGAPERVGKPGSNPWMPQIDLPFTFEQPFYVRAVVEVADGPFEFGVQGTVAFA